MSLLVKVRHFLWFVDISINNIVQFMFIVSCLVFCSILMATIGGERVVSLIPLAVFVLAEEFLSIFVDLFTRSKCAGFLKGIFVTGIARSRPLLRSGDPAVFQESNPPEGSYSELWGEGLKGI